MTKYTFLILIHIITAILSAIWIYIDTKKQNRPKIFIFICLVFPPIPLYYFIKYNKDYAFLIFIWFSFLIPIIFISFFSADMVLKMTTTKKPEIVKKTTIDEIENMIIALNNDLMHKDRIFQKSTSRFEKPTKSISKDSRLRDSHTRAIVLKESMENYIRSKNNLIIFIKKNKELLIKNKFYTYISLLECYDNDAERQYLKYFNRYIESLFEWTSFCSKYFNEIREKQAKYVQKYETLFLKYRTNLEIKNNYLAINITYVKEKLKSNPELIKLIQPKDISVFQ